MNSADSSMSGSDKPSQAEGEDPDRPAGGSAEDAEGHPSQAEGEDPADSESPGSPPSDRSAEDAGGGWLDQ